MLGLSIYENDVVFSTKLLAQNGCCDYAAYAATED